MATTFGRSPGGYLWAIIEPIFAIALLAFAFSLAFQSPPLGTGFALFYASGYLPYMVFHDIVQKTAVATRFSRPLLSFGAVGWVETIAARFLLNSLTQFVVSCTVIFGILKFSGYTMPVNWIGVLGCLTLSACLALGVGSLNCFLFLAFPASERIWTIALRPLFIVSGVLFLMEDAPAELQNTLWFNPLLHISGSMREAIFAEYNPHYIALEYVLACGLISFVLAGLLLKQCHDDLILK